MDWKSSLQTPHHDWNTGGCPQHVPHLTLHDPFQRGWPDLRFHTSLVSEDELQHKLQLAKIRGMVWWPAKEGGAATSLR